MAGIPTKNIYDELRDQIAVEINGDRTMIPRRQSVNLGDLKITEATAPNGVKLVRVEGTFGGQDHGLEVPFESGSQMMGKNQAIEKARAEIERSVNLILHEKAGREGEWKPGMVSPGLPKKIIGYSDRGVVLEGELGTPLQADRLVEFANAMAAYTYARSAEASGIALAGSAKFSEEKLRAAYVALVDDIAAHVAAKLKVVAA